MSELQWLIHMLTKQKLPTKLKDLFISRIGEVEQRLSPSQRPIVSPLVQAPSTQRLLDAPVPHIPIANIPPAEIDKSTGRPMVMSPGGTKGPRKW